MTNTIRRVRKAVLPAAGLGTRFLPATKAQPKEMLPVVDKPLIQYAVEECAASGIENIIIVTGRRKNAIEDHFDSSPELERFLEERGQQERAEKVRNIGGNLQFSYTRQREPRGLGDAVLTARDLVGDEPFAVLLGDVIFHGTVPATQSLAEIFQSTGQGAISVSPVPRELVQNYGIVEAKPAPGTQWGERLLRVADLVEKPAVESAPSNLSIAGRYVLPPEIFSYLEATKPGRGGEVQLTDALRTLAQEKGLWAHVSDGNWYDAGDKLGFLKATVELALRNAEFGAEFRAYLRGIRT
ncbi:MAG: UTP--glucose-1-phosphate uridylyltransferase GalU [Candidatus Acidiferrales bacterium]